MKYPAIRGRDSGDRLTPRELVAALRTIAAKGDSATDEFCEYLDREFLHGCWGNLLDDMERARPGELSLFLKDIRGILWTALL